MMFVKPAVNETFTITSVPEWPGINFETDGTGAHTWHWTIAWDRFTKSGSETTTGNQWDAKALVVNCGGTLTVRAEANNTMATVTVKISGTNPSPSEVAGYLAMRPNSAGFDKIVEHESKFKHFNMRNEPIKSFDNGYGMCQLTNPAPTFDQVWNWKMNVEAALNLFEQKRANAIVYLSQNNRTYTNEQLKYEAVCRWNGGAYHVWDAKAGKWVRPSNILCDSKTGNIGWNMDDAENKDKTEEDLHKRDSGSYSKPPGTHWKYYGVCYADSILG